MSDDRLYLIHISECLTRLAEYTTGGRDEFLRDYKTQDAVLRKLQTLAESTQRLAPARKALYPEIDWRRLAGFRNILVHDYLGINLVRVWEIVERNLPDLQRAVDQMLAEPDNPSQP